MITVEPNDRPPAAAVLKHPAFWSKDKILTFLQDCSDRVDKEEDDSYVLNMIEKDSHVVTRGDWQMVPDEARALYGKMPAEFSDYWTGRFPRLLTHAYLAMQCVKYETNFGRYYCKDYDYVPIRPRSEANIRRETDLNEEDVDLINPRFLTRPPGDHGDHAESNPQSLVSTWSQLDSGNNSRLQELRAEEVEAEEAEMLPCRATAEEEGE